MTQDTGLPEEVSLGDVLSRIMVSPAEAAHMLQHWGAQHSGSAQPNLTNKLNQTAADITNPESNKQEEPQAPPTVSGPGTQQAPDVVYANPEDQNTAPQNQNRPLEPPLAPPDQNR